MRPGMIGLIGLVVLTVLPARVTAQTPRPLMPIEFQHSAEFRWLNKEVLASRPLDDMTDPGHWRFEGTGELTFPAEPRLGGMRVLRVDMTMFHDEPAPTRNGLSSVNLRRDFAGEDWSAYNRISLWIRPDVSGFPMLPLQIVLHNEGEQVVPDAYYREGIHYVTLRNDVWQRVVWEIEPLARDSVTAIEIGYWVKTMIPTPADPMRALQAALTGRYILQGELGRGGMAIVYLAYEVALDRMVALKLLPPGSAEPGWRDRFLREARAAARLSHANIVPIYAVDRVGEFVFFTMGYVDGETLLERVERTGPLSVRETMSVIKEAAEAAAYAHRRGVIHRDLAPGNIILERGSDRAMIMDFGIAVSKAEVASDAGEYIEGTFAFMSPERVLGQPEDPRSDLYALGATAYYAATGRPPFDHARLDEILRQHVLRPPPPLGVVGQDGDTTLAHVVELCLAKDPAARFQTADELGEALAQAPEFRGETPVALRAFVARSRLIARSVGGLLGVGGVAVVALIAGLLAGDSVVVLGAAVVMALLVAAPLLALLPAVRRVLKAGSALEHMVAALREDLERAREELVFELGRHAERRGRALRLIAYGGLVIAGLATAWLQAVTIGADVAIGVAIAGVVMAAGAGAAGLIRARRRRQTLAGKLWVRFWNSPLGAWTAAVAGLGVRLPDRPDPLSRVPAVVHLMDTEIKRIHAWIERENTFETEVKRDITVRLEGNLATLVRLRARIEGADQHAPPSGSLTTDLAAARAVCEMVQHLIDANREVEEICRTPHPGRVRVERGI
jgi:hypothetical protein